MRSRSQFSWKPAKAGANTNISPASTANAVSAKSRPAKLAANARAHANGANFAGEGLGKVMAAGLTGLSPPNRRRPGVAYLDALPPLG